MRSDRNGRRGGLCAESGAGMGAGAGVGLTRAIVCGRERREGAQGAKFSSLAQKRRTRHGIATEIAWRLLGLLAMAVCVTGGVFLLTVAFVALS